MTSTPKFLSPGQLAARWQVHPGTLELWRRRKKGPNYIKIGWKVRYPLEAVEAHEAAAGHQLTLFDDQASTQEPVTTGDVAIK